MEILKDKKLIVGGLAVIGGIALVAYLLNGKGKCGCMGRGVSLPGNGVSLPGNGLKLAGQGKRRGRPPKGCGFAL
jgi:hypothetical protein